MKAAPFLYAAPDSLAEALALLAREPDETSLLAGGQSLVPLMNLRLAKPSFIVDINRIPELATIRDEGERMVIGPLVRHATLESVDQVKSTVPLLSEAASMIGHPQIRHRGTIGGSLAEADPAAQLPTALLALEGSVVVRSAKFAREISARDLFVSALTTSLQPDEMITEIRVPPSSPKAGSAFLEVVRRQGDFALVGVAVVLEVDGDGLIRSPRIVLAAMDATPVRATEAEQALDGQPPTEANIENASHLAARSGRPSTDTHATSEYRKNAARTLVGRALKLALLRARNGMK